MTIPNTVQITDELIAAHGLKPDEYQRILDLIGREPTFTELGIFSAMWNEHCSYKSSKKWLRTLPTSGPRVIQGPGENAGVVDIGDGDCVVFKMESHNHPSYIEPYQGAATGVGGILRDVFTMGARPIAAMNALRFGAPDHPKTRHLVAGVVAGIGGYGNSFGVPTVGGEVEFDARYNGNCLVNAFAAGLARTDAIFYSKAEGVGLPVVYLGAKTGRDGVGGATMASAEFDDTIEEKRPTVQVGDPFTEKCLLEACLELMATGAVIAIQDMGAAGLTCSAVEMGAKGDLGIELDLDRVPVREDNMSAYEMMLSESQERMLMVLRPEKESRGRGGLPQVGSRLRDRRQDHGRSPVPRSCTRARRSPTCRSRNSATRRRNTTVPGASRAPSRHCPPRRWPSPRTMPRRCCRWSARRTIRRAAGCGSSTTRSSRAIPLQRPGGDAGVVRVDGHPTKALAFSSDVNPHYCEADAYEGGKQAVAECWRNLTAVGAEPLAVTDNLNFGNPERPEIMGQFVKAIEGIGEACTRLSFPIVSGNVSLYNETFGEAILPTPTIAGVGLIPDWRRTARIGGAREGDAVILLGGDGTHLGATDLYARDPRPDGRPAAAGRSRPGAAQRRFRPLGDPQRPGNQLPRPVFRRSRPCAGRDGDRLERRHVPVARRREPADARSALRRGSGALCHHRAAANSANFICMNAEGAGVPFRKLGTRRRLGADDRGRSVDRGRRPQGGL